MENEKLFEMFTDLARRIESIQSGIDARAKSIDDIPVLVSRISVLETKIDNLTESQSEMKSDSGIRTCRIERIEQGARAEHGELERRIIALESAPGQAALQTSEIIKRQILMVCVSTVVSLIATVIGGIIALTIAIGQHNANGGESEGLYESGENQVLVLFHPDRLETGK